MSFSDGRQLTDTASLASHCSGPAERPQDTAVPHLWLHIRKGGLSMTFSFHSHGLATPILFKSLFPGKVGTRVLYSLTVQKGRLRTNLHKDDAGQVLKLCPMEKTSA